MVRPTIEPANNSPSLCFIFAGSSQLLVGPASSLVREQMKVRSSTRATSAGSERTRKLLGRFAGSSGIAVPVRTSSRSSLPVFLGRAIAPVNPIGFADLGDFFDPASSLGVGLVAAANFDRGGGHGRNVSPWNELRLQCLSLNIVEAGKGCAASEPETPSCLLQTVASNRTVGAGLSARRFVMPQG